MNARVLSVAVASVGFALFFGSARLDAADEKEKASQPAEPSADSKNKVRTLGILLFPQFELLDACGPAEMFGNVGKTLKIVMVAEKAGPVASTQGVKLVADYSFEDCPKLDLVLVPGGFGTFTAANEPLINWLKKQGGEAEMITSVCSGSAMLAKAGLLDDRKATTNKQYYSMITAQGKSVKWVKEARWVDDGNIVTSSGVSAGMDMALHVISRLYGEEIAQRIADGTEYTWHRDADVDPFVKFAK